AGTRSDPAQRRLLAWALRTRAIHASTSSASIGTFADRFCLSLVALACGDDAGAAGPSAPSLDAGMSSGALSFATDVYAPIIAQRCSPCHTEGASGGLDMRDAATAFGSLVEVDAAGAACRGEGPRVASGDPDASLLVNKIEAETPRCGNAMPLGRDSLPASEQETVRRWIAQGAQP
ncbi:MAG: hypothetical protein AAF447_24655, partial [Myxococcota bacterium]